MKIIITASIRYKRPNHLYYQAYDETIGKIEGKMIYFRELVYSSYRKCHNNIQRFCEILWNLY